MADTGKPAAPPDGPDYAPTTIKNRLAQWRAEARENPFFFVTLCGAAVVMLLDQASKAWVVEVLRLPERRRIDLSPIIDFSYVENKGASFGMLSGGLGSRILLSLVSLTIAVLLVSWLAQVRRPLTAAGFALLIGGALGNLIDRVLYGHVIDFIDASALWFPFVFNVADVCINIGVACVALDFLRNREEAF